MIRSGRPIHGALASMGVLIGLLGGGLLGAVGRPASAVPDDPPGSLKSLIDHYLVATSEQERTGFFRAIEAKSAGQPTLVLQALARRPERPPYAPGRIPFEIHISDTDEIAECTVVVPRGYDPTRPWPLWISMHGTGGNGRSTARLLELLAHQEGFLLACPTEHPKRHGKGWGYSDVERALTLSVLEEMKRQFQVDTNRVFLNGWSRGGHASYDIAEHYPALFAGTNPIIGAPRAHYFGLLRNLKHVASYVMNGAKDQERLVSAARKGVAQLRDVVKAKVTYFEDADRGHEFLLDHLPTAVSSLLGEKRDPYPSTLLFASVSEQANEGSWIRIDRFAEDAYRPGATIKVRNLRRLRGNEEERTHAVQKAIFNTTAFVEGRIQGSRIILKTERIKELTVLLAEEMIDLDRTLRVTHRGKPLFRGKVDRDLRYLLDGFRKRRDPKRLFWNEVSVKIP